MPNRASVTYFLAVLVLAYFASKIALNTIGFEDNLQSRVADLLTNLGVLLIVMERSLEIFTQIWRRQGKLALNLTLDSQEQFLEQARKNWESSAGDDGRKATYDTARNDRDTAEKALEDYRSETGTLTVRTSLVIGIVISTVGFRILETLFVSDSLTGLQLNLFNIVDILVSSGVLAGGSSGVHLLSSTLGKFFETSNKRLRQSTIVNQNG